MKKSVYGAAVLLTFAMTPAAAEKVTCELSSWKGAKTEEDSISWTGLSYVVDTAKNRVSVIGGGEILNDWRSVTAKSTKKFTTYVVKETAFEDGKSTEHDTRYGYRIYNSGKCNVVIQVARYRPIEASGRVK